MKLEPKGEFDNSNPQIPEDYYISMFEDISHYSKDEAECLRLIINFKVEHDGEEVVLPFFAPAKLSVSEERESSRLAEQLSNIGLLETVLDILDDSGELKEKVMSGGHRAMATSEDEVDELMDALKAALTGKKIRVNVEDDQSGEQSQVSKFSRIFDDEDESESDDEREAVFVDEE